MSVVQEMVHRCVHPLTKITANQVIWKNTSGSAKLRTLIPNDDAQWQLALDPCSDKAANFHSIKIAPSSSFKNRTNLEQAAKLTLKLHMQDPNWEFAEIIFNPDASTRVYMERPSDSPPEEKLITAQVDLSERKLATLVIDVPALHPQLDLSSNAPIFEFFIRGKHLKTGRYFCTEEINIFV
ncbi:hypothetical protein [Pseudoalteromonas luteoviolacea]|uniref:Uncharacterized protein n=1 Tax=Pseudoalteromonas luteoviolacea S4060-1 TaxID=1365257 RepID=A0A167L7B5_9GAMM|nr:hypothetical protein [Pseudoalteromonas luteoviolacea]KZN63933.1 hypothetical protein N478_23585 [Pseudoalteromonas luteoviolacea S4060-1]